jgi:hypothetical protein
MNYSKSNALSQRTRYASSRNPLEDVRHRIDTRFGARTCAEAGDRKQMTLHDFVDTALYLIS